MQTVAIIIDINATLNPTQQHVLPSLKIDFGEAQYSSGRLNARFNIINSELWLLLVSECAGSTYKFSKQTETKYACTSCITLGNSRTVTVKNGRIIGRNHPEDDHHIDCRSVPNEVLATDRETSSDISRFGEQLEQPFDYMGCTNVLLHFCFIAAFVANKSSTSVLFP